MYPSGRFPKHPFRVLPVVLLVVIPRGDFPHAGTKGVLPDDVNPSGVHPGSRLGSLYQGAT